MLLEDCNTKWKQKACTAFETTEERNKTEMRIEDCRRTLSKLDHLTESAINLTECAHPDIDAASEIVERINDTLAGMLQRAGRSKAADSWYVYDLHMELASIVYALRLMDDGDTTMTEHYMNLLHVLQKHFRLFRAELEDSVVEKGDRGDDYQIRRATA